MSKIIRPTHNHLGYLIHFILFFVTFDFPSESKVIFSFCFTGFRGDSDEKLTVVVFVYYFHGEDSPVFKKISIKNIVVFDNLVALREP